MVMAEGTFSTEQFWAELDALGEEKVRERAVVGAYGSGHNKKELAQEWLRQKDQARALSLELDRMGIASKAAEAAIQAADAASRAAEGAEEQARFARSANTRATLALVIAVISAIVALFDQVVAMLP
jgi:hypothetical protein